MSSVISYYGEAGLLWPITRDFSLGTSASGQFVSSGGTLSPKPILELGVLMRFYFGHSGASSSASTGSNEWQGWRYPFGYLRK